MANSRSLYVIILSVTLSFSQFVSHLLPLPPPLSLSFSFAQLVSNPFIIPLIFSLFLKISFIYLPFLSLSISLPRVCILLPLILYVCVCGRESHYISNCGLMYHITSKLVYSEKQLKLMDIIPSFKSTSFILQDS